MSAVLQIRGLRVEARGRFGEAFPIVSDVDLSVARGEVLAVIGESGAGKSTVALAALGYARPGCTIVGGQVILGGAVISELPAKERRRLRGSRVAYIAQSAAAAFNPALTLGRQIIEAPVVHGNMTADEARKRALALAVGMKLPFPELLFRKYPHQVSGGQLQRLMAVMAMTATPELLILDEPTTAIDVTTQVEVLWAFKQLIREHGTACIYVTHDLSVVAQMADRIIVLNGGKTVEEGTNAQILHAPRHVYTRQLLSAQQPSPRSDAVEAALRLPEKPREPLLRVEGISVGYPAAANLPTTTVLQGLTLDIMRGEVIGVIGESGCGKSTLARAIVGLLPPYRGRVLLDGQPLPLSLKQRSREDLRRIQIVFQMPDVVFNPKVTVGAALERPLVRFFDQGRTKRSHRVRELLDMVHLPASFAARLPAELSGGQKQRVSLARALAASPDLILCDEVTASLDTVVGAAIMDLLRSLQHLLHHSYLFISHNLTTVESFADRIMVLYAGRIVEQGRTADVLSPPFHPYTRLLVSSVPEPRQGWLEEVIDTDVTRHGIVRSPVATNEGCPFHPRCPLALPGLCDRVRPRMRVPAPGHLISCHRELGDLA